MGNNVFLSSSEFSCNVWLDMNNNIITNLPSPVNPTDGVNKTYVDNAVSKNLTAPFIKITPIPGLVATNVQDALSEINKDMENCLPLSGGTMLGSIDMNNNSITNLATPTQDQSTNAANVQYVNTYINTNVTNVVQPAITKIQQDIQTNTTSITSLENSLKSYLPLSGGTMTGDLQMNNHTVTGLTTPNNTNTDSAANVQYVNTYITTATSSLTPLINTNTENIATCNQKITSLENSLKSYLPLSGGTMTGDLQMNNHTVTGLTTPNNTNTDSAANVQYVNNILSAIHFSPFYTAIQLNPPSISTADSGWVALQGSSNTFFNSSNSNLFFSFDASYVKWFLLQKGLYLFNFTISQPYSSTSAQINVYLNDAVASSKVLVASFVYDSSYGGYTSSIIPISTSPQMNQYYLTFNATTNVSTGTTLNLIWLPTG